MSFTLEDYVQNHITLEDCEGVDAACQAVPAERSTCFVFVLDGHEYRLSACELRALLAGGGV
jgi:hypothetical protein